MTEVTLPAPVGVTEYPPGSWAGTSKELAAEG